MSNSTEIKEISQKLGEPEWVFNFRNSALVVAEKTQFPYKYGININALLPSQDQELVSLPTYEVKPSKGIEIYTWKEAVAQEEIAIILQRLLESELLPAPQSLLSAKGRASFRDGLVVYVQPSLDEHGNYQKESLIIETKLPLGAGADLVIVIVKEGAMLDLEIILSEGEATSTFVRNLIVVLEQESSVTYTARSHDAKGFFDTDSNFLVGHHAKVDIHEDFNHELSVVSGVRSYLIGENSSAHILHTLTTAYRAIQDISATVFHKSSHTTSKVHAMGIAGDTSKIIYRALIDIAKGVKEVNGEQEGKFLLGSKTAEIDAIPAQDIASKEVVSSHKLSISHIKDADLFYAESRGIKEDDARMLAVVGYFSELLQRAGKSEFIDKLLGRLAYFLRS